MVSAAILCSPSLRSALRKVISDHVEPLARRGDQSLHFSLFLLAHGAQWVFLGLCHRLSPSRTPHSLPLPRSSRPALSSWCLPLLCCCLLHASSHRLLTCQLTH